MKRKLLFMLLALMLVLTACSGDLQIKGKKLGSYSSKDGLMIEKVVKSEGTYYAMLKNRLDKGSFQIAKGKNIKNLQTVYTSGDDASAQFMDVDDGVVAWTEINKKEKTQEVKVYRESTSDTETINTETYSEKRNEHICENVGIYDGNIFYATVEDGKAYIDFQNLERNTTDHYKKVRNEKNMKCPIICFNVNEEDLILVYKERNKYKIDDLKGDFGEEKWSWENRGHSTANEKAKNVYAVAFDDKTGNIAVYYEQEDGTKSIGYMKEEYMDLMYLCDLDAETQIPSNQFECYNGLIIYIEKQEESGKSSQYSLKGCDFEIGKLPEIPDVYTVSSNNELLYAELKEGVNKCNVYKGKIKKEK